MSDRELWDALTVLARRMDLLDPGERLTAERVPVPDAVLCLAFGTYQQVRLCCTHDKGHEGLHSWERACVGKSACVATVDLAKGSTEDWRCEFVVGHDGVHGRTGADGVLWTWTPGGRPAAHDVDWSAVEMRTDSPEIRCKARSERHPERGSYFTCSLVTGHEGAHKSALGTTWTGDSASEPTAPRT